ncbi:MAG: ATP synthase F1 subunit gamma [Mariniphaga sp.]|jgi:F-type H+-transporting ATPase subunit gamma|nr:ATP synthase F1 subunit gamma [Mariniphaga sp.]
MAGLKEIRTRIGSVKTTRQVTSAMKMISAARLKKAQDAILQIRPYANKLHQILVSLGGSLEGADESVYTQHREPEKILIVLVSSNRGLCGGFNMNIAKKSVELVHNKYSLQFQLGEVDFICIGRQAEKQVKLRGMNVVESQHELFDTLDFDHVYLLAEKIMKRFVDGKYDKVELVYNQFLNAATQINTTEQFLPIELENEEQAQQFYDYIFEPSKEYMIQELIPKSLKIQFYKAMLDSHAAEHGARMTAMHQATDNATELLKDLTLQYNKLRQASITNEILEIVSGAEALKG